MKNSILLVVSCLCSAILQAQEVKCHVIDDNTHEPISGAVVRATDSKSYAISNIDGIVSIHGDEKCYEISCLGYLTDTVHVDSHMDILLKPDIKVLSDVTIVSQTASSRRTPVAASTLYRADIEERIGNQEIMEVLKYTPGVYTSVQGGGWGDSEVYMRGFDNTNIAVLINGVPANFMEDNSVYWSDWAGLSDVANVIQSQRGIGASLMSCPSVGGTINITTKQIETKLGGNIYYMLGNDGYNKLSFGVNSGQTRHGWTVSLLGSGTWGNGYAQGTDFRVYNYFVNVSKKFGRHHQISLTSFGSPQTHYMRSNALTKSEWEKVSNYSCNTGHWTRFNPDYGFSESGERKSSDKSCYFKPFTTINHIWEISDRSSLSTSLYAAFGRGSVSSGDANSDSYYSWDWMGASDGMLNMSFRKADGTYDYCKIEDMNRKSESGSEMIMAQLKSDQNLYGLISSFATPISERISFNGGIDCRYMTAHHYNVIDDLFCGEYYVDPSRSSVKPENNRNYSEQWATEHLGVGDVIYRDYDGNVFQAGAFAQAEYSKSNFNVFLDLAINNTSYWRYDRYYYDEEHARSETKSFLGGTAKAGANWNINKHHNIYANVGFLSKAPQFKSGAFMSATSSHMINPDAKNEKALSAEIGYGLNTGFMTLKVNGYITDWIDKSMSKKGKLGNGTQYFMNLTGVGALHMGIEVEMEAHCTSWLDADLMAAIGDWNWKGDNAKGYAYDIHSQALTPSGEITTPGSADHAWATINMNGVKVGGSAQTTIGGELTFKPCKGLKIAAGYLFRDRNYAYYSISGSSLSLGKIMNVAQPWKAPASGSLDARASYQFNLWKFKTTVSAQVNNILDSHYIEKAWNPANVSEGITQVDPDKVYMFYNPGRTWSVKLKFSF